MKSHIKKAAPILILPLLSIFLYFTFQQENVIETKSKFSQVRIFAVSENDFRAMANSGLLIDHGILKRGEFIDAWLSGEEISRLKKSGVPYQILIGDWQQYYESQPKMSPAEIDAEAKEVYEKDNITHSIYGSMGGYMTYSEVVSKLDSMRMWYPQFISSKFSIGTSYEGRQIWAVRVTKNPDAPTGRPEALYHALIHAREPESMETQFYYMFWLFENYDSDPLARFILNSREIYWVPIYNADGYVYNQTTNPNGGGMWRCNRHFTSGSCGPVDLNRNYGIYQYWNSPNGGSSTDPCNGGQGTYRGTNPFSEPEVQAMMNFVNSRNFSSAVDAHAFGNYLIKPWAWIDPQVTPDDNKYEEYLNDMKASNPIYHSGTSSQTLGYYIRGGSYDWYYTDSAHSGHNIIAILPETGTSFWPPQNQIIPLAQGMLFNNQYISLIAGPYIKLLGTAFNLPTYTPGQSGTYKVRFRNKGLMAANNTRVIWTAGNNNVTIPVGQFTFNVPVFSSDSAVFNFTVSGGAPNNCYIPTTLTIKQDTATVYTQNIYIPVGAPAATTVFNDQGGNFSNWNTNGTWNITTSQYNSPPSSFTDSPGGNYQSNTDYNMTMINAVNVSNSQVIYLSFYHRYATELNHDFCIVEISSNNRSSWQTVSQYSGILATWTQQIFDITRFTNFSSQVKIRFRLMSDASTTGDGWYVDDIVLTTYCTGQFLGISGNNLPYAFSLQQNYPNPFNPVTQIKYSLAKEELVTIAVYDILGRKIMNLVNGKQKPGLYEVKFDGTNFASGLYFYKIEAGNFINVRKMILLK